MLTLPVAALKSRLIAKFSEQFKSTVIERWTRYRASAFFDSFCRVVDIEGETGVETPKLDEMIRSMLSSEVKSEILFDAYRRVCFSASKDLGPKIIGILAARLVNAGVVADEHQELMFSAAEALTDSELVEFSVYHKDIFKRVGGDDRGVRRHEGSAIEVELFSEEIDLGWQRKRELSLSPASLRESVGTWALKLKTLGMLHDETVELTYDYEADSERHVDEDGTIRKITHKLVMPPWLVEFVELIERASGPLG